MTYYGVVLLLSGFQADGSHTLQEYKLLVDRSVDTVILTECSLTCRV